MSARGKLLKAARVLFAERGFAGTTTAALAREAGVAEVTLFRRFGGKEALFAAALTSTQQSLGLDSLAAGLTGDLQVDLPRIVQRLGGYFHREQSMIRMVLFESVAHPELVQHVRSGPTASIDVLRAYFEEHIDAGQLPPCDPLELAETLVGGVFGVVIALAALGGPRTVEQRCASFASLFLAGLGGAHPVSPPQRIS